MSEIDGYQHSCIGYLFGLPLYHPIDNDDDEINSNSLILGGGSGEHPMLIVNNLEACLQNYIHFHDKDCPEAECDYRIYWSIEDSYNVFPEIKPFMDRIGVKSAEEAVILAMGDFLRSAGGHFAINLGHVKPETFYKAITQPQPPWEIIEVTSEVGGMGKIIRNGNIVWGISFIDEINHFNEARIRKEVDTINANITTKLFMKNEAGE